MKKKITPSYLIKFEEKIAKLFNNKKIKAPVHLYFGNEKKIINIFKKIKKKDWVFCSWRSHYQCLLKGVPEKKIIDTIIKGKSISLCFKESKSIFFLRILLSSSLFSRCLDLFKSS